MLNYTAMIVVCTIGIVFFDDDTSHVSVQEWVLGGIMIYASIGLVKKLAEMADSDQDDY